MDRTHRKHIAIMEVDFDKSEGYWIWTGRLNKQGYGLTGNKARQKIK